jgi:hypothetical protein
MIKMNEYYFQDIKGGKTMSIEKKLIIDEIKYLNIRLHQIAYNGDCAYEKKLSDYYIKMKQLCHDKLLQLV